MANWIFLLVALFRRIQIQIANFKFATFKNNPHNCSQTIVKKSTLTTGQVVGYPSAFSPIF